MEALHPICRIYPGISPVSCHVCIRDFATCPGIDSKSFLLKDFAISRPLPSVKHQQFSLRRPQQLRRMCLDVSSAAGFAAVDFFRRCPGFAALDFFRRCPGFAALNFFRQGFAAAGRFEALEFFRQGFAAAARFAARCFLMASRARRRSLSALARDSNFASGFFNAFSVSLCCLRASIAEAMTTAFARAGIRRHRCDRLSNTVPTNGARSMSASVPSSTLT